MMEIGRLLVENRIHQKVGMPEEAIQEEVLQAHHLVAATVRQAELVVLHREVGQVQEVVHQAEVIQAEPAVEAQVLLLGLQAVAQVQEAVEVENKY